MVHYNAVSRITTTIAVIIAVMVAVALPAAYFVISSQYKAGSIDAEAELASWRVEGLVAANPTMWQFEEIRLQALLQQRHNQEIPRASLIRDMQGSIIAQASDPITPPFISRRHEIFDAGTQVAIIEISQSLAPLFRQTMLVGIFSAMMGIAIYFVLRMLPLRALTAAYQALEEKAKELRQKERYERALLDNFPFVVWLKDTEGRYLSVNKEFVQSVGLHEAETVQGKNDFDLLPHDRAEHNRESERGVLSARRRMIVEEEIDHQGVRRWFESYRAPVLDENGELLGTVGFSRDITDRKEKEKEHMRIEKLESLGILAGGIAHDFNNILTGIMGNISFARMFLDTDHKSFKLLAEAEKASVRASELAQQLLTFSRGGEPVKKIVSLQRLMKETVSFLVRGSTIKAVVDIPDSVHAIEADEGQISQVFSNIILNSMQAMSGGGRLTITAENETVADMNTLALEPGAYVRITLADEGCGISETDLTKIFDPYFSTKKAGRGLGLASVYSIVKRHGGHIGVSSTVNGGTTFKIYLPSTGSPYVKQQTAETAQMSGEHEGGSLLVMDDEKIIRDLATEMFTHLGYQVTTCAGGEEAISLYQAARESGRPFSAVIMDLTIPGGMGGQEAAQHILALDPEALLIVSSGYSNDPIMADFRNFGFSGAVAKPYNVSEFGQVMSRVLQGKRAHLG